MKGQTPGHLNAKMEELKVESHVPNIDQKKNFIYQICEQIQDENVYKSWERKCLHIMDKTGEVLVKHYQRHLNDYYEYRKHHAEWEDKLDQHKKKLHDHTR